MSEVVIVGSIICCQINDQLYWSFDFWKNETVFGFQLIVPYKGDGITVKQSDC